VEALRIVVLCVVASILYGVAHDQVTIRICLEYFTVFHPPLAVGHDPTTLALAWGVVATWWMGAMLGLALAACSRWGSPPRLAWRDHVRGVCVVLLATALLATAAGVVGHRLARAGSVYVPAPWAERIPAEKHVAFLTDLWAHNAAYLSSALGGLVLCARALWRRRALSGPRVTSDVGAGTRT
jgi:hypothetical protein